MVGLPDVKPNYGDVQTAKFEFEVGEFIVGTINICDTSVNHPKNFLDKLHNNVGCLIFHTNKNREFRGGNDKLNK